MIIENDSLEVLRTCGYSRNDMLGAMVSDNLYLSIVVTNVCQRNCPYCINSLTDKSLSLPLKKGKVNNICKAKITERCEGCVYPEGCPGNAGLGCIGDWRCCRQIKELRERCQICDDIWRCNIKDCEKLSCFDLNQ